MATTDPLEAAEEPGLEAPASSLAEGLALAATRRSRGVAAASESSAAEAFLARQARMLDIQMEHLHEQRTLILSHLRLRRANEGLKVGLQIVSIFVGLLILAGLVFLAAQAASSEALVVKPLRTTPELAERGLDGTVLASQLLDRLRAIEAATDSARAAGAFTKDFDDGVKLEIPQTGVSVDELQRFLRQWLGHDTHISGEVFRAFGSAPLATEAKAPPPEDLVLTVRAGSEPGRSVEGPPADLDSMVERAAESLVEELQPYRYAVFLTRQNRLGEADQLLERLAFSGPSDDRAWAFAYGGVVSALATGDLVAAERRERSALALDPDLAIARDNLAGQEVILGHEGSALGNLEAEIAVLRSRRNRQLSPVARDAMLAWARTKVAEARGDYVDAVGQALGIERLADYEGSVGAAVLNQAASQAAMHDVGAARATLADITAPPPPSPAPIGARAAGGPATPTSSLGQSISWGSELLPEVELDRALDDWAAMDRDLAAAAAAARPIAWGPTILRTYVWPMQALVKLKEGDIPGAESLIDRTPLDGYAGLRIRGLIAAAGGRGAAADSWFARALAAAPNLPFADQDWGEALLGEGRPDAALERFETAQRLGPKWADPLEGAGEALVRLRRDREAAGMFERAARYAPHWGRLNLMWALALGGLGDRAQARDHLALAAGMNLQPGLEALVPRLRSGGFLRAGH